MKPPAAPLDTSDFGDLAEVAPALARMVAQVASDIALVIDADGVIRNVAQAPAATSTHTAAWVGRRFEDVASSDTRKKVQLLLQEAHSSGVTRRREINHPAHEGASIPVAWTAVRLGQHGPVVAVGRDLRAVGAIQQRLVQAQQELERDYWQRRQVEQRYRQLFRVAHDAVLVLDAESLRLLDGNDWATELFGAAAATVSPAAWPERLPQAARAAVTELLLTARSSGRAAEIRVRAGAGELPLDISATPLRIDHQLELLVRARRAGVEDEHANAGRLAGVVDASGSAVVITDSAGRLELANVTFTRLLGLGEEAVLRGRALAELVGDDEGEWQALLALAQKDGISPSRWLRLRRGAVQHRVAVQASLLTDGEQLAVGFTLRPEAPGTGGEAGTAGTIGSVASATQPALADPAQSAAWARPAPAPLSESRPLARAAARLGQAPLGELLAQALGEVEHELITVALLRCAGQPAAAALLLGLSRDELERRLLRLNIELPVLRGYGPADTDADAAVDVDSAGNPGLAH